MADELTALQEYGNREKALSAIEKNSSALQVNLGEEGIGVLKNEVDRLYPESQEIQAQKDNVIDKASDWMFNLFKSPIQKVKTSYEKGYVEKVETGLRKIVPQAEARK